MDGVWVEGKARIGRIYCDWDGGEHRYTPGGVQLRLLLPLELGLGGPELG